MNKFPYKVGQYLSEKRYPKRIHRIVAVNIDEQKIFIRNIDASTNQEGSWNSYRVIKKYLDIIPGYNTPLWKILNDRTR